MRNILLGLFVGLGLLSCTETVTTSSGIFGEDTAIERRGILRSRGDATLVTGSTVRPGALSRGSDHFVNLDRVETPVSKSVILPIDDKQVEVSLINASITTSAKAVLGDALGLRYTVDNNLSGNITLQSTGPIPKEALLELYEAALSANGARLSRSGDIVSVVAGTSGNRAFRLAQDGVGSGSNIIVAQLEYISSAQMVNFLTPLINEGLTAVADKRRNLLMLTGSKSQLEAALDALNLFDVDVLAGKSIALIELETGDPDAVADELKVIFESEEGGNLDGVIEFVPNKRLGSILVISSRSRYLPRAQRWIRELDRAARGAGLIIQTYELDNRNSEEIAPILNDLLQESQTTASNAEGEQQVTRTASSRVGADKARNALIVRATRAEHRQIRALMNEIDTPPQQVMLEATIAEVSLKNDLSLGVRWYFENNDFNVTFSDTQNGSVGGSFPGFSALFNDGSDLFALNALADATDVQIISSPNLMVLDNQEAVLQIGDQVPIATQTSTSSEANDAPTITQIDYRDTGVILTVKPSVSTNGSVVLDISQEISSVLETKTSGIDSPTIRQRKIATNVLLKDGMTLALGGLVQENNRKVVTKVPGLGDAPVIGGLFRSTENTKGRSELLLLIRPRVIYAESDSRSITEYWRSKLSSTNSLLETGLGSTKHSVGDIFPCLEQGNADCAMNR